MLYEVFPFPAGGQWQGGIANDKKKALPEGKTFHKKLLK
jgi:hypothetical protein